MKHFILRLAAGTTFLLAPLSVSSGVETMAGRWEGFVEIPGRELKLIIDLAQDSGGAWVGSIIIPALDVKGMALAEIAVNKDVVSFAIKGSSARPLQATFKGVLKMNGALAGDFVQAGNIAPFALERIGSAQVELSPKSTPITKELEGEWKGEYELSGYPRHVTIKLVNRPVDGATAEFVVVGKKTSNLPVDLVMQEGDLLTIDSHETSISYEGRFRKDAGEINGTLTLEGIELPLVLQRTK